MRPLTPHPLTRFSGGHAHRVGPGERCAHLLHQLPATSQSIGIRCRLPAPACRYGGGGHQHQGASRQHSRSDSSCHRSAPHLVAVRKRPWCKSHATKRPRPGNEKTRGAALRHARADEGRGIATVFRAPDCGDRGSEDQTPLRAAGGRRLCQSVTCWYACPILKSTASSKGRPYNWIAIGSAGSPAENPHGNTIAGMPVMLAM